MKTLILVFSFCWNVSGQIVQSNQQEAGLLCRCELPGENIYEHDGRESYVPLRIGDFYVLDEHHESCKVTPTPLVDAVVHGIQHWASFFYPMGREEDHPHRSLSKSSKSGEKATKDTSYLRSLSHTTDGDNTEGVETQDRHGIAPFVCPDFDTVGVPISDPPSPLSPTPAPQAATEIPSVLVPTLDIIGANETSPAPTNSPILDCPANELETPIYPGDAIKRTFDMAVSWYAVSCNDAEAREEQTAVWVPVLGNGDQLQASTCSPDTNFLTSLQVVSGTSCSNITCVAEGEHETGNCPPPNIFGSTLTWSSEPNEQYWILVSSRGGDETSSSSDEFGLTVVSLEEADTPVPTAAPISSILGTTTLYPTAAPLANISPVYDGASILNDNHSCESAFRLFLGNNTSDSVLGTTIGAPSTITCWDNFNTPAVWFSVVGTGQILEVSMSERVIPFPPLLSIIQGDSCDDQFLCWATGLDTVAWQSRRGEQYWVLLQGRDGAGDYGLMIRSFSS